MKRFLGINDAHSLSSSDVATLDSGGKATISSVFSAVDITSDRVVAPRDSSEIICGMLFILFMDTKSLTRLSYVDLKYPSTHSQNIQGDIKSSL